jgi:galactose oxidase-like protein/Kelch motif protein
VSFENVVVCCAAVILTACGAASAEARDTWSPAGGMTTGRFGPTETLLPNGKVLVTGGGSAAAELYDPAKDAWSPAASMANLRRAHTATLLLNGKVLVVGRNSDNPLFAGAQPELYDPANDTWSSTGGMTMPLREGHTATLLADGDVLVAGGQTTAGATASAERYHPATDAWSPAADMPSARIGHTATLLAGGKVLVAGGSSAAGPTAGADLYDPKSDTWTPAADMAVARLRHTATRLANGTILVSGGDANAGAASAEIYHPAGNTWSRAPDMSKRRSLATATLLSSGKVLVAGGHTGAAPAASAELYDPARNAWSAAASMAIGRYAHAAVQLANGKVLVTGGLADTGALATSAELYEPAPVRPAKGCRQPGSTLVRSTTAARLYDVRFDLAEAIVHYACAQTSDARSDFGQTSVLGSDASHLQSATPIVVTGHYGAGSSTDCINPKFFRDSRPSCQTQVFSIDLLTGKTKRAARGSAGELSQNFVTTIHRVVLQTTGSIAWTATLEQFRDGELIAVEREVWRSGPAGTRRLDAGDDLDVSSLRLNGLVLRWTHAAGTRRLRSTLL